MGIFSQDTTKTNQTAYNQQLGVNTGNTAGGVTSIGGGGSVGAGSGSVLASQGSVSAGGSAFNRIGGNVSVTLDATALDRAAQTVDNALSANTALAQQALQGFQGSNTATSEQPQAGNGLSPPPANAGNPFNLPSIGGYQLHITDFLWVAIGVVGIVLVVGYMRKHKR